MKNELEWTCIYYNDENDTDGSLIYTEFTMQAYYRGGVLVKHTYHEPDCAPIINMLHISSK